MTENPIKKVSVYCASSNQCDPAYLDAAYQLGEELARNKMTVIFGGGAAGLMGKLADGALAASGEVIGVIPGFMQELEWGHKGVTQLHIVRDMHERKRKIIDHSDAFVALPGGCGTLEELLEVITWKRLGLHRKPVVIANLNEFYSPCIAQLEHCVRENFMHNKHLTMWQVATSVAEIVPLLSNSPPWHEDPLGIAVL